MFRSCSTIPKFKENYIEKGDQSVDDELISDFWKQIEETETEKSENPV